MSHSNNQVTGLDTTSSVTNSIDLYGRLRIGDEPNHLAQLQQAKAAGLTTVVVHPCRAEPLDTSAAIEDLLRVTASSTVSVKPVGALTAGLKGEGLTAYAKLKAAGCIAVGQGDAPMPSGPVLRRAFEYAASSDMLIILRPEDVSLAAEGFAHEGAFGTKMGLKGVPVMAETVGLHLLLAMAEQTGARLHLSRISSAAAAHQIRAAKKRGMNISADVAIANLLFTDESIGVYRSEFHVTPVLRAATDREKLRAAVLDGTIDAICSNHHPQPQDAKLAPFPQTEPGMSVWPQWQKFNDDLLASEGFNDGVLAGKAAFMPT